MSASDFAITRLDELLADRALQGLTHAENAELSSLLADAGWQDDHSLDLAAASTDLMFGRVDAPMPASLRSKLEFAADRFAAECRASAGLGSAAGVTLIPAPMFGRTAEFTPPSSTGRTASIAPGHRESPASVEGKRATASRMPSWGWAVMSVCLLVALVGWFRGEIRTGELPPERARAEFLQAATDTVSWPWAVWDQKSGLPGDPAVSSIKGDVVWSPSQQRGYMKFRGINTCKAGQEVYQLWIIDATRPDSPPVDGGVFEVSMSQKNRDGEVIVPIAAKLPVGRPAAFAITMEPPGGVVVSKQDRRVAIAVPPG
jgi:hypothetical protein